jgi:S1-C subfamily serine protease
MIFTYPMPSVLGIDVNPDEQTRVRAIKPQSPAARAGLRAGDVLVSVDGQRILSAADFARVLELTSPKATLPVAWQRDRMLMQASLDLSGDWKKSPEPSWRSSLYVAGPNAGFWGEELTPEAKRTLGLSMNQLALRTTFFFGGQQAPIQAGLKRNDVIIEVDGKRERLGIRQFHAYCQMNHDEGDNLSMTVLRDGKTLKLTMRFPEVPAKLE